MTFSACLRRNILPAVSLALVAFAASQLPACEKVAKNSRASVPPVDSSEARPGGKGSVSTRPFPSSELPVSNLPKALRSLFHAGKALAHQPWVKAPTATEARDGLGPLYNARTCLACHKKGGRGHIPGDAKQSLVSSFLRLSIPGKDAQEGAIPEPNYGLQLQTQSTALSHQLRHVEGADVATNVAPEAQVAVSWKSVPFVYPDGTRRELREPEILISELGYGPLHKDTLMSLRVAPSIHGAGLIELIPQAEIDRRVDGEDADGDGVSGRTNLVWDFVKKQKAPGRFGYKANRATLQITVAGAFAGDIGITSSLFPGQPCSSSQEECQKAPTGADSDGVELSDELLALVVDFNRNLGVPLRTKAGDPEVLAGREVFYRLGCQKCHTPNFKTRKSTSMPHLGGQSIWPYSDFLLHDMGEGLSDGRPDYEASGSEWRTAPLWGLGTSAKVSGAESYLHDGRARSIEEAVLWHGGEAEKMITTYLHLDSKKRQQLLSFLASL